MPESEDDDGHFDGDAIAVTLYAESEICNGGFFQFYINGIFLPDRLVECLREIGATELAQAVADSKRVFPNSSPPVRRAQDREPIEKTLRDLGVTPESFAEAEDRYFSANDELVSLWAAHIRKNSERYWGYVQCKS